MSGCDPDSAHRRSLPMFHQDQESGDSQSLPMFHQDRSPAILNLYQCFTRIGVRRFSIFTNVLAGSESGDSQSLPIFSRFTNRKTQLLSLFQAAPAPMTGAAASQYLLRTL